MRPKYFFGDRYLIRIVKAGFITQLKRARICADLQTPTEQATHTKEVEASQMMTKSRDFYQILEFRNAILRGSRRGDPVIG